MKSVTQMLLLIGLACGSILTAAAQQPGSAAYNSVYLPAHGVGDTQRNNNARQWGAFASGKHSVVGWTVDGSSAQDASDKAVAACEAAGGEDCGLEFTFGDQCAVVASGPEEWHWKTGNDNLDKLKRQTLRQCGRDCSIIREGCALPRD
ncbi:DUF4189 domain-containing protein [Stenotrophomonas sp.]|uniref:DUF4189 domain-containing protein n=1 Tax=Stenotrophomonas sp. TaxID=69392 RepID=UPI0028A276AD|nr:DUF4189 domain-containing protein [Stenotrophomonas sp.]